MTVSVTPAHYNGGMKAGESHKRRSIYGEDFEKLHRPRSLGEEAGLPKHGRFSRCHGERTFGGLPDPGRGPAGWGHRDYRGQRGRTFIKADITADKANALDYDVIIVPGGHAPDKMRLHPSMIELVRTAYDSGKIVAAICHGPQLLISAGIVSGRRMTSSPSIAVDLQNAGAEWVDYPVVRDGNIITSRKPADIPRFNKAIIVALQD